MEVPLPAVFAGKLFGKESIDSNEADKRTNRDRLVLFYFLCMLSLFVTMYRPRAGSFFEKIDNPLAVLL